MLDALVAGRIHGTPSERTSSSGKSYATCKVRVSLRDGSTVFASVIAFEAGVVNAILAFADGDSVAIAGELTPKVWSDKDGTARPQLDVLAHAVLSAYSVARKRRTVRGPDPGSDPLPFDDELPGAA
jgi:single-stranded DNA-binding protein